MSIEDLLTRPIPEQLWHYTSYDALQKIVESKQIWATDLRYLNDHQEFLHAIKLCQDWAEDMPVSDAYSKSLKEIAKPMIQSIFEGGALRPDRRQIFVASFSESKDQLSQWRAYSGTSSGISISFDLSSCRPPSEIESPLVLAPCVYDDQLKIKLIEQSFSPFIDVLDQWVKDTAEAIQANPRLVDMLDSTVELSKHVKEPILRDRLIHAAARVNLNLMRVCPLLKHHKFSEEAEWRLVVPVFPKKMLQQNSRKFRPLRDTLVPYLSYSLPINNSGSISINGVIMGPGSHKEVVAGISSFLECNNLLILPKLSDVPYRPW